MIKKAQARAEIEASYIRISDIKPGKTTPQFPQTGTEVLPHMEYFTSHYRRVAANCVDVVDDNVAARNYPLVPGFIVPRKIFEVPDACLNEIIGTLTHEPFHRLGQPNWLSGFGGHDKEGYMKLPSGRGSVEAAIDGIVEWANSWVNPITKKSLWDEIVQEARKNPFQPPRTNGRRR